MAVGWNFICTHTGFALLFDVDYTAGYTFIVYRTLLCKSFSSKWLGFFLIIVKISLEKIHVKLSSI
jgi:hypothetical protein